MVLLRCLGRCVHLTPLRVHSLKTSLALQATAKEIAWGVVLLTARLFDRVAALLSPDGAPRWASVGLTADRLEGARPVLLHSQCETTLRTQLTRRLTAGVIEEVLSVYELTDAVLAVARGAAAPALGGVSHSGALQELSASH